MAPELLSDSTEPSKNWLRAAGDRPFCRTPNLPSGSRSEQRKALQLGRINRLWRDGLEIQRQGDRLKTVASFSFAGWIGVGSKGWLMARQFLFKLVITLGAVLIAPSLPLSAFAQSPSEPGATEASPDPSTEPTPQPTATPSPSPTEPTPQPTATPSPSPTDPTGSFPSPASSSPESAPLIVGLYDAPPFAIKSGDDWDGISVHLWREIARELGLDYELRELEPDQVIDRVEDGTVDVAITAIATASDEQRVDFTQSYYLSALGIAQRRQQSLFEIVRAVLSPRFLKITLWLSAILVVIGVLVWLLERHHNDQFEKGAARGIWTGFWWAGVTMSTIGYGDKTPKTVGGRILALLWMLVAMGITASLTASITSVLTTDSSSLQATQFPQGLWDTEVGSVPESESAQYLQQENIQFQPYSAPLDGMKAVQQGDTDLFVYSAALLKYLNRNSLQNTLQIETTANQQVRRYAFALPENSELYDSLNQTVLQEIDEADWRELLNRYMPDDSSS